MLIFNSLRNSKQLTPELTDEFKQLYAACVQANSKFAQVVILPYTL